MIPDALKEIIGQLDLYDGLCLEPGHVIADAERFRAGLVRDFQGGKALERAAFIRLGKAVEALKKVSPQPMR